MALLLAAAGSSNKVYMEYNNRKEEAERKKGYPDRSRGHYGGPGGSGNNAYNNHQVIEKRVVLARCIYGVYYRCRGHLEYTQWWDDLHYDLVPNEEVLGDDSRHYCSELEDERTDKYFGVLRRRENYPINLQDHGAPKWIVAVRGTEIGKIADLWKDAKIVLGMLRGKDFKLLLAVLKRLVTDDGCENVVLTGHSLGASAAMLVGRKLALEEKYVDAHLFNPPFVTLVELVRISAGFLNCEVNTDCENSDVEQVVTIGLNKIRDFIRRGLHRGTEWMHEEKCRSKNLAEWAPNIYVNTHDLISKMFVHYFTKEAESCKMRIAESKEPEAFHLLPRAVLHISKNLRKIRFISSHMLWNWARPDLPYEILEVNLLSKSSAERHDIT